MLAPYAQRYRGGKSTAGRAVYDLFLVYRAGRSSSPDRFELPYPDHNPCDRSARSANLSRPDLDGPPACLGWLRSPHRVLGSVRCHCNGLLSGHLHGPGARGVSNCDLHGGAGYERDVDGATGVTPGDSARLRSERLHGELCTGADYGEVPMRFPNLKVGLLMAFAFPALVAAYLLGWGRAMAFVVYVCFRLAPETTNEAIHSRVVMGLWETIHKGM